MINPSQIYQSRLQCNYNRMSNPATIHRIGNQIFRMCFSCNLDSIDPICLQSAKNGAIRQQSSINPNLTAGGQVQALNVGQAKTSACVSAIVPQCPAIVEISISVFLQSWHNRGSRFLQSTGLSLNCGKFTILLQLRPIELNYFKIVRTDTWHWHKGFLR